jgi:hypothetical protein
MSRWADDTCHAVFAFAKRLMGLFMFKRSHQVWVSIAAIRAGLLGNKADIAGIGGSFSRDANG